MAMLQRQASTQAPSTRGSSRGGQSGGGRGNSARAERIAALSSGPTTEEGAPIPTQRGPEVTDSFDPRARPAEVSEGDRGALVGRGTEIVVRSGKTSRSRELFKVADGTPAEVVTVSKSALRVRVRNGDKETTGWVARDVFTDQPFISRTDDSKKLPEDYQYSYFGGDHSPVDPKGTDTAQGALGDCFFIASMAAVANAAPKAIQDAITYDPKTGRYKVRFFEETRSGMKPVYIDVDAYLPTERGNPKDPAYAGDPGAPLWPAILEKAYAQFKGGYDVIGEGGTGFEAMAELTGVRSKSKSPAYMRESEVVPYFKTAKQDGLAIYAGVRNTGTSAAQATLTGTASGPYTGTVSQIHKWNEIEPGTLSVTDKSGQVASARDRGQEGDETGEIQGRDVAEGEVQYKASKLSLRYNRGKQPKAAGDLEVNFEYHGMLEPNKVLIGNHAYAFEGVVQGDLLQFYNPWGSYQPKPITAAEFLKYFDSLATNAVPGGKRTE